MSHNKKGYAVVTGASSGIGACFAKRLAREGYDLILVARRRERLESLCEEISASSSKNVECIIFVADLSKQEECKKLYAYFMDKDISIFINNAGFGDCNLFIEGDIDKELSMIDVNIKAMHYLTKMALSVLKKKPDTYLLNVASSAGLMPAGPYMATYYATKAYVASLTRAIAEELHQTKCNISVSCLCPGPVQSEFDQVANVQFSLKGMRAEVCANYAIDQMFRKKTVIVPTLTMKLAMTFGRFLPQSLYIKMAAHQQRKKLGSNV